MEYHKLLSEPLGEAQRIAKFLDVPLNIEGMASQIDPSLYLQHEKQGVVSPHSEKLVGRKCR
jgi:hypothetical protein